MARSPERTQFLSDLLSTSLHYSWFRLLEADWDKGTAKIKAEHDENYWQVHEIGPDDVARGLRMYREWMNGQREGIPGAWSMRWETEGEKAPASSYGWQLVKADRTNGEEGDYDVTTADSALQFAVFGHRIYG